MSLPEPWVNKLFNKLAVTYGQGFLRQYDGVDLADVKANWAEELSGFQQNPSAIAYGLEHLPPSKAPTVLEFKELCRKQPPPTFTALPAPPTGPVDPSVVAKARKALKPITNTGNRDWARVLQAKEKSGIKLSIFQREAWREAGAQQTTPELVSVDELCAGVEARAAAML